MSKNPEYGDVSLRDIAARVGCSHATVSRALRDNKRVSKAMTEKIKKVAKEMGYRPNPMIASLMATHNRKAHRSSLKANIGWLNMHPEKDFWHQESYSRIFIETAEARAKELAYGFEELWALEQGLNAERLKSIALARGIQGFIVPAPVIVLNEQNFDWDAFAITCVREYQIGQLDWHRASISVRKNVNVAYQGLRSKGYRRIGIIMAASSLDADAEERATAFNNGECEGDDFILHRSISAELSGFLYNQAFVKKEDRVQPFLCLTPADGTPRDDIYIEKVANYLKEVRPEAVICGDHLLADAAERAGLKIPDDLAVAHLGLGEDVEGWAGIETYRDRQASAAVDLLCAAIERNERGLPKFSKSIHIEGDWRDGWTAPQKS